MIILEYNQNKTIQAKGEERIDPPVATKNLREAVLIQNGGVANIMNAPASTFSYISGASEREMYKTEDDYGTSYYYRGAVENNYVLFANTCWRIVRIVGDGSVKLVLFNYNPDNLSNPCTQVGDRYAFARYGSLNQETSSSKGFSSYNGNDNDAKYVGYMYGGPNGVASTLRNGSTSSAATYNQTSSLIKENFEKWYLNNLLGYDNNIADTLWCNDRQLQSEVGGAPTGLGYGNEITLYAAYYRLVTNKTPSLKCGLKNDRFTKSDTTMGNGKLTYPIGALTIDEISHAGGGLIGLSNSSYYLYKNTGENWWTMTPYSVETHFSNPYNTSYMFYIASSGSAHKSSTPSSLVAGLRPSISLKKNTKVIVTGEGTATNPFEVVS